MTHTAGLIAVTAAVACLAGAAGAQTTTPPALTKAAAEALRQATGLPDLHGYSALPDTHSGASLPNGVANTAVEHHFGGLTTAAGFLWFGDSLISGFGVLAALLLGAALGLPVVLGFALYLGQRSARRPLATWFWADRRQQLSGLSLADEKVMARNAAWKSAMVVVQPMVRVWLAAS